MSRPQFCLLFWDMWDIVWRSKFSHHFLIENLFSEFLMLGSFCTQLKVFWNRLVPCQGLTPKWAFCCGSHSCLEIYHLVCNCSRINNDMTLYSKCTTWMINLIKCSLSLDICTIKKLKYRLLYQRGQWASDKFCQKKLRFEKLFILYTWIYSFTFCW